MITPASMAAQKFWTCSGWYSQLASSTEKPLITTINRPNVSKMAGRLSNTTSGLSTELISAKIRPDTTTTQNLLPDVSNSTLVLNSPAAIHKPNPQTNQRTKNRYTKPLSIALQAL